MENGLDLAAYRVRTGFDDPPRADLATLIRVHRAHVAAIPFENLDVQLGIAIALDLPSLQAKLVRRRRGGYCFEHNTLFAAALGALGFDPRTCEARVRLGAGDRVRPRTHMILLVDCGGSSWLADVGFGADGLCEPVALDGTVSRQAGSTYRVASEPPLLVLQRAHGPVWEDLYAFRQEPVQPVDFEVGNWFTSTHPDSPFVRTLTAQRIIGDARHILRNLTYTITSGGSTTTVEIEPTALTALLRGTFAIDVPDTAAFRALDSGTVDRGV